MLMRAFEIVQKTLGFYINWDKFENMLFKNIFIFNLVKIFILTFNKHWKLSERMYLKSKKVKNACTLFFLCVLNCPQSIAFIFFKCTSNQEMSFAFQTWKSLWKNVFLRAEKSSENMTEACLSPLTSLPPSLFSCPDNFNIIQETSFL